MGITTEPQIDTSTIWQVTEEILAALRDDVVLNPYHLNGYMHLDYWWEQPFFEGDEYALPPLCYYISAQVVSVENEQRNRDFLTVDFTIYMEWRTNADSHVGALTKANWLGFKPWQNAMHRCLAGRQTANMFSALRRVQGPIPVPGIERKGILHSSVYRCSIYDHTATPEQIKAHIAELDIKGYVVSS